MAIIRNCAVGPQNKARKICEKSVFCVSVYDARLQISAVIYRCYSLDPNSVVLTTLRNPETRPAIAVSNAGAQIF